VFTEEERTAFARKTIKAVKKVSKGEDLREEEFSEYFRASTVALWVKAGGFMNGLFVIGSMVAEKLTGLIQFNIIAIWADRKLAGAQEDSFFLWTLVLALVWQVGMSILSNLSGNAFSISAGRVMHEKVLDSMFKAPIDKCFDKDPVGRLIQRLSGDMGTVDGGVLGVVTGVLSFLVGMIVTQSFIFSLLPWWVPFACIPMYSAGALFAMLYTNVAVPLIFQFKKSIALIQELQTQVSESNISMRVHGMSGDFMARFNNCCITVIRAPYISCDHLLGSIPRISYHVCLGYCPQSWCSLVRNDHGSPDNGLFLVLFVTG